MNKYIYDENNGLWYELQGDYYIPCLTIPKEKPRAHWRMGAADECSTRNGNGDRQQ